MYWHYKLDNPSKLFLCLYFNMSPRLFFFFLWATSVSLMASHLHPRLCNLAEMCEKWRRCQFGRCSQEANTESLCDTLLCVQHLIFDTASIGKPICLRDLLEKTRVKLVLFTLLFTIYFKIKSLTLSVFVVWDDTSSAPLSANLQWRNIKRNTSEWWG